MSRSVRSKRSRWTRCMNSAGANDSTPYSSARANCPNRTPTITAFARPRPQRSTQNSPRPRRKRSLHHRRRERPPLRLRLLPSRPLRYIEISEGLLESSLKPKITNRSCRCQGGEIGRRARFRIAKSSISKRRFSFQNLIVLREQNGDFRRNHAIREW